MRWSSPFRTSCTTGCWNTGKEGFVRSTSMWIWSDKHYSVRIAMCSSYTFQDMWCVSFKVVLYLPLYSLVAFNSTLSYSPIMRVSHLVEYALICFFQSRTIILAYQGCILLPFARKRWSPSFYVCWKIALWPEVWWWRWDRVHCNGRWKTSIDDGNAFIRRAVSYPSTIYFHLRHVNAHK